MAQTKPIRDALRAVFYPHVLSPGFEVDTRLQPQFVVFRRLNASSVHVFDAQWDKYHRPRFMINFSEAPVAGVDFCGTWMDSKDISPVHCGSYLRLVRDRGKFTHQWFQLRRPLLEQLASFKRNYEPEEIAIQVLDRFHEIEEWWAEKTRGKHVLGW